MALDRLGLVDDVVAEASTLAAVGRKQAAKHADRSGLAAAIGTKKTEDLAAPHVEREILDDVLRAKVFVQAAYVDDDIVSLLAIRLGCHHGLASLRQRDIHRLPGVEAHAFLGRWLRLDQEHELGAIFLGVNERWREFGAVGNEG